MSEFAMLIPIPDSMPDEEIAGHASVLWFDTVGAASVGDPVVKVVEHVVVRDDSGQVVYDAAERTDPETGETWTVPRRAARVSGEVLDARAAVALATKIHDVRGTSSTAR